VREKRPLGNERPFLSASLFALFYQAEIRQPQLLNNQNRPLGGRSMPRRYNAIAAILQLPYPQRRRALTAQCNRVETRRTTLMAAL
jgi:hypothetical protein